MIIASPQGGMNIEEVAEESPDALMTLPIDIVEGIQKEQAVKVAKFMGFSSGMMDQVCPMW